jgi:2-polyprenyl-6-methoxyphenol hydroxylase-like FAD-dependent oxidoreductase
MTDIDGLQHQRTVPFGKVHPKIWAEKQAESNAKFAGPIKELVAKIEKPFVTAISDCISPRCSFFDGKLFLVGDALALFRPHLAQSTNQSALHCLLLEKLLQKQISVAAYENEVMMYAHTTLLWSREVGAQYLYSYIGHMYHKMRYRLAQMAKQWGVRL